jgi:hypothetical protein
MSSLDHRPIGLFIYLFISDFLVGFKSENDNEVVKWMACHITSVVFVGLQPEERDVNGDIS